MSQLIINTILLFLFIVLGFKIAKKVLKIIFLLFAFCAAINILSYGGII